MKLSKIDLISIQDCLESYGRLIEWMPVFDDCEQEMKSERTKIIGYLQKKCEACLREECDE